MKWLDLGQLWKQFIIHNLQPALNDIPYHVVPLRGFLSLRTVVQLITIASRREFLEGGICRPQRCRSKGDLASDRGGDSLRLRWEERAHFPVVHTLWHVTLDPSEPKETTLAGAITRRSIVL